MRKLLVTGLAVVMVLAGVGVLLWPSKAQGANMFVNGSAETVSTTDGTMPAGWQKGSWGTNSSVFTYETSGRTGARSVKTQVLSYVDGDAKWFVDPVNVTGGASYVFTDYYKSDIQTELFAQFTDQNGVNSYEWLGTTPASNTAWAKASFTFPAPASARKATVLHIVKSVGFLTVDDATLEQYTPPAAGSNLVPNPSLATAASGNAAMPESWLKSSWGTNTTNFQYLTNSGRTDSKSVKVTLSNYTDGDAKWHFSPVMVQPGKKYVFTDFYQSNRASRILVATYDSNNAVTYTELSPDVAASSTAWQSVSRTFTTPANATKLTVFHLISGNGWLQIDDASVTEVPPESEGTGNMVGNNSVETSANGTTPDGWATDAWGTNTRQFSYLTTGQAGSRSLKVQITGYTNGDAKWFFNPVAVQPNKAYTYSDYYQSNVPTELVLRYTLTDGSFSYVWAGTPTAATAWAQAKATFTTPATAVKVTMFHLVSRVGFLTIDNVDLRAATPDPVPNPSLETAAVGNASLPANWQSSAWGTNTPTFQYVKTEGHTGSRSAKVTIANYTDGDAKWVYDSQPLTPGNSYRFTAWYKTNTTPRAVVMFTKGDGTVSYAGLPQPLPSGSTTVWQQYSDTFTVPAGTASVSAFIFIDSNGWVQTDDYSITPYQTVGFSRPLVSLTFDDGHEDNVTTTLPKMNALGIKSTQCFATEHIEGIPAGIQNVQAFKNSGHEICSHTVTHPFLSQISASQLSTELQHSKQVLEGIAGAGTVRNFASPYGDYSTPVLNAIKPLYRSHRTVDEGYNSKDNFNAYRVRVQNMLATTTLAEYQGWLDKAKADKTWLVLVYHRVAPAGTPEAPGEFDTWQTDFDAQMQALVNSGLTVKTYNDALDEVTPQL